eukprot:6463996-Amphidinium_carterae.1
MMLAAILTGWSGRSLHCAPLPFLFVGIATKGQGAMNGAAPNLQGPAMNSGGLCFKVHETDQPPLKCKGWICDRAKLQRCNKDGLCQPASTPCEKIHRE